MRPAMTQDKRSTSAAFLLAFCLLGALALPVAAAPEAGDVYVAGGDVHTGGPIRGDFGAAGGKVSLDEPVAGDAWLAGGSVEVRAPVRDRLRVAAGEVNVDGVVGGQLVAAGGQLALGPNAVVGGDARLYGGRVNVDGRVDGNLHASARRLVINGVVRGDVDARAETIELGPNARITGTLRYSSRTELRKAEGASIAAVVRQRAPRTDDGEVVFRGDLEWPRPWRVGLAGTLSLLACGAIFLLLVPRYGTQAAERLREGPLGALTLGVVAVVALPVVAVLLCITILGIPLGLLLLMVYPVLLLAGFFVAVLAIARALAQALRKPPATGFAATFGWFVAALLLVMLVGFLPAIGKVAIALMVLGGTGAALVELQRRRKGDGPTSQTRPVSAGLA